MLAPARQETEIPVHVTDFVDRACDLLPSFSCLVEQLEQEKAQLEGYEHEIEESTGAELDIMHNPSEAYLSFQTAMRTLMFNLGGDKEQFLGIVRDSIDSGSKFLEELLPDDGQELEEDPIKDVENVADSLERSVTLVKTVQQDFYSLDTAGRAAMLRLLCGEHQCNQEGQIFFNMLAWGLSVRLPVSEYDKAPIETLIDDVSKRELDDAVFEITASEQKYGDRARTIKTLSQWVVDVCGQLDESITREEVIRAIADNGFDNAPMSVGQAIHSVRQQIIQGLEKLRSQFSNGLSIEKIPQDRESLVMYLSGAFEKFLLEISEQNIKPIDKPKVRKRRSELGEQKKQLDRGFSAREIEHQAQPFQIFVAENGAGEYSSNGNTTLESVIEEYAGNDSKLRADLRTAFEVISKFDFRSGSPRGVGKYEYEVMFDGKMLPVYGIKPQDVQGMPKLNKGRAQTRILMIADHSERKMYVMAIVRRDSIKSFERNRNLGNIKN